MHILLYIRIEYVRFIIEKAEVRNVASFTRSDSIYVADYTYSL